MPQSKSDVTERDVLDWLLRTRDAQLYIALLTADPGEGGAPSEPATANGYARLPIHFAAAATNGGTNASTAVNDGTTAGNAATIQAGPPVTSQWTLWGFAICRGSVRAVSDIIYKDAFTGQPLTVPVGINFDVIPGAIVVEEQ